LHIIPIDFVVPSQASTCFPKISPEIVAAIFDEIEDASDCFCLALTSQRCWLIGQPCMKAFALQHATMWAGDQIICTGDYLEPDDLPECLSSLKYEKFVRNVQKRGRELSVLSDHDPVSRVQSMICGWHHVPPQDRRRLLSPIRISYRNPEILRNISKRQYVRRSDFLEMCKACPEDWRMSYVDLGHVVVSRFCWSSDPSASMAYQGDIHRGVWAGDRFDITSADAIEERDENGQQVEWTDVTGEVINEIRDIWSCVYGSTLSLISN
jgi:hypothetical protein